MSWKNYDFVKFLTCQPWVILVTSYYPASPTCLCVCVCVMNLRRNDFINFVLQRRREDQKIGCRDGEGWLSFHGRIIHVFVVFFTFCKYPLLGIGPAGLEPTVKARNRRKAAVKKNEESPLKDRCHERDYTYKHYVSYVAHQLPCI